MLPCVESPDRWFHLWCTESSCSYLPLIYLSRRSSGRTCDDPFRSQPDCSKICFSNIDDPHSPAPSSTDPTNYTVEQQLVLTHRLVTQHNPHCLHFTRHNKQEKNKETAFTLKHSMWVRCYLSSWLTLPRGANRGIGKPILEAFINQGEAKVYATVRSLESAQPLVATHGGPCRSTAWMLPTEYQQ